MRAIFGFFTLIGLVQRSVSMLSVGLLYALVFCCSSVAYASPSTECPTPVSFTVTPGGSHFVDESSCSVFGLSGVSVSPSHGTLTGINPVTGNGTGQFTYVNDGLGALSDTFTVLDDSNGSIVFNVTVQAASSTVTSVSPTSGPAAGGTSVTITGTNFTGATAVKFGATAASSYTVNSATSISATAPAHAAGTVDVTVTTTNGTSATSASDQFTYTAIILSPSSPLTAGTVGSAYSQTITASGGTSPYTFAITTGALPAGLSLSSAGVLSGTPTAGGSFNFTVTATDNTLATGSQAYALTVNAPTITVSPNFPPNLTVGSVYSQTFTASGGTATYTYAVTSGSLPAGTTLSSAGILSGTPTQGGTFNFTITAADSSSGTGPYTGSHAYTLLASAPTITVSPSSLPAATVGSSYSQTISASGGTSPYTFAVTAGSLPAGLSLSSSTGALTGTPTAGGTFNFTVTATDSSTGTGPFTGSRAYSLTVSAPTIVVSPASLPNGTAGVSYSQTISASGGTSPYTFAVTAGALPAGLSLSSSTGVLSGAPTASGPFNFTVTVTDSSTGTGPYTGSRAYTLTVVATVPNAPANATATGGNMQATVTFTAPTNDGGSTITGYTVTSNPAGGIDSNAGSTGLSHLITGLSNGTAYTFTVVATNSVGDSLASAASNSITPATFTFTADCNAGSGDQRLNVDVYLYIGQTATINTQNCSFAYTSVISPDTISPTANGNAAVSTYFFTKNSGTDSGSYGLNVYHAGVYGFLYYFHPTLTFATSGGTTTWTESNSLTMTSTPIVVDSGVTIDDHASPTLSNGTVSITGGFQSSEDVLAFTNNPATMGNISASYTSGTGVLALSSSGATATLAQWQAALRAITYNNTAQPPTGSSRTINFVVNDGTANSATATKTISLTTVNHPPIFTLGSDVSWPLNTSGLKTAANFATLTSLGQSGESGQAVLAWQVTDSTDPAGVVSGIQIQPNGTLLYALTGQSGTATISVQCQDNGGIANGGNDTSVIQTFHITVDAGWNLSISMDDNTGGKNFLEGGDLVDYTILVQNIGTSDVHNAVMQDTLPSNLLEASWTCEALSASTCTPSGTGDISDTVTIPKNSAVIYHLTATVQADPELPVVNTATVTLENSETDIATNNNTASLTDEVGLFRDGFESLSGPMCFNITVTANAAQTQVLTLDVPYAALTLQPRCVVQVHDSASTRMAKVHVRQHQGQTEARLSWRNDEGLWQPGTWQVLNDPTQVALAWSTEAGTHHDWPLAEVELAQGSTMMIRVGVDR